MKIGIISDTHDHHANILKAIDIFNKEQVQYILHAGDIGSRYAANAFGKVSGAKFIAVYGNNDGEKDMLKQVIETFGGEIHKDPYQGQIEDKKIFITHKPAVADMAAESGKYDLVVYGHTHFRDIRTEGKTLVINPGESTDWASGKGRIVILETENSEITEFEL
ncbi:MAG: metallophosphoesterase [Sedimentisphaerales bacterium]|nr:metallophosphoesterase [Sedimentisphaerales bacterium]